MKYLLKTPGQIRKVSDIEILILRYQLMSRDCVNKLNKLNLISNLSSKQPFVDLGFTNFNNFLLSSFSYNPGLEQIIHKIGC